MSHGRVDHRRRSRHPAGPRLFDLCGKTLGRHVGHRRPAIARRRAGRMSVHRGGRRDSAAVDLATRPAFARLSRLEQLGLSCTARALEDSGLWPERSQRRTGLVMGLGAEIPAGLGAGCRERRNARLRSQPRHAIAGPLPPRRVGPGRARRRRGRRLRQRRVCPGIGPALAAIGLGRRLPGGQLRSGHAHGLCRLPQPPRPVPAQRFARGHVAAFRPRPRRLRDGRGRRRVRPGGGRRRPAARRDGLWPDSPDSAPPATPRTWSFPAPTRRPPSRAIRRALADAAVNPEDVDYVNAHAAGTPVGDRAEAGALHLALGPAVAHVPVSSTKSMTGHLLSGAASVEAHGLPGGPASSGHPADDQPGRSRSRVRVCTTCRTTPAPQKVSVAISNSLGFGGSNTCIVLRKAA